MRWRVLRFPLSIVLFLCVLADLQLLGVFLAHGFPPSVAYPAAGGGLLIPTPTTNELMSYSLFIFGIALVQALIIWMTLKAWRAER